MSTAMGYFYRYVKYMVYIRNLNQLVNCVQLKRYS